MIYRYLNKKKHIISGVGLLKNNFVTDKSKNEENSE